MKNPSKIKKWQLLSWKGAQECADLRGESFLSVGKHAFRGKKRLEEVVFPEGMTAIKLIGMALILISIVMLSRE